METGLNLENALRGNQNSSFMPVRFEGTVRMLDGSLEDTAVIAPAVDLETRLQRGSQELVIIRQVTSNPRCSQTLRFR